MLDFRYFTSTLNKTHPRPEDFWYDQSSDEWVLLLKGSAELDLDGRKVELMAGDHLLFRPVFVIASVRPIRTNPPSG